MQSLAIAAMGVASWILWSRAQPERLFDFGRTERYDTLRAGVLYRASYRDTRNRTGLFIVARPVDGGAERVVLEEDARNRLYTQNTIKAFAVADGNLYYGLVPVENPPKLTASYGANGNGVGGIAPIYLGEFALSPSQPSGTNDPRETRVTSVLPPPKVTSVRFRQAPTRGGAPRDLAVVRGSIVAMLGKHVFWIRPGPATETRVTRRNTTWTELLGRADLMMTDLDTGAGHKLDTGLSNSTSVVVGEGGVFWTRPRPFPDNIRDLYYARAVDGAVVSLGQVSGGQNPLWSVEHQGSVYWLPWTNEYRMGVPTGVYEGSLMAAGLNGANLGPVFASADVHREFVPGQSMASYHGTLYCLVSDVVAARGTAPRPVFLARVHRGRPDPLEIVRKLPGRASAFQFDGGYLYYSELGQERGVVETLTGDDAGGRLTDILMRIPLPE